MKRSSNVDILICGAGASGLTLAIDLARRGVSFRLIEKMPAPFTGSRGKGIQPRSLEIFEDLGIVDPLFAAGGPYPLQRVYQPDGRFADLPLVEASVPSPGEPFDQTLMVPQSVTERLLRDRLAEFGRYVDYACELTGFEQDADCVTSRIQTSAGEEVVRASYLIGADGGRSAIRRALAVDFSGETLGVRALVADVSVTGLSHDVWHRFGGGSPDRQLAMCPLAGTDLFQMQAPIPLEGDVDLGVSALNAMIIDRTGRTNIRVEAVQWASAYSMNARLADRYRVGRTFLVGDAAHTHPPTGGQGLNTSVQDAYNLGWKLSAVLQGAPVDLLDTYEEERRPVAASVLGLSTGLLTKMQGGEMRRGRDVQQLDLSYAGCSLAHVNDERQSVLNAGDRAPDAELLGAASKRERLFNLFVGPDWSLLRYGPTHGDLAPRRGLRTYCIGDGMALRDDVGQFHDSYGVRLGASVLVRPDGYIGMIVGRERADDLESYLAKVGLGKHVE